MLSEKSVVRNAPISGPRRAAAGRTAIAGSGQNSMVPGVVQAGREEGLGDLQMEDNAGAGTR